MAPEILQAMATPMIGHRMTEYAALHKGVKKKLRQLLFTEGRVFLATSSAFGVMEGAVRNLVGKRCANFCNGAFSDKWHKVTLSCGKEADPFKANWGEPITPEMSGPNARAKGSDARSSRLASMRCARAGRRDACSLGTRPSTPASDSARIPL